MSGWAPGWNRPEVDEWWSSRGAENPWQDTRTWSDVAANRNHQKTDEWRQGGNPAWAPPSAENPGWGPGSKPPRFHHDDDDQLTDDPIGSGFTARKKHGWWGKTEYFDEKGRKIE